MQELYKHESGKAELYIKSKELDECWHTDRY